MANLRQDRVSGPALSQPSPLPNQEAATHGHPAGSRGTVLAIRLITSDRSGTPMAVSWAAESPVSALAVDIITASGGVLDQPQGDILPSQFTDTLPALLAARRLQWALEGLAECSHSAVTASVALYSLQDTAADSLASALKTLDSAQVILSSELADSVHQVPGVAVQPASNENWRVAEWQSPDGQQSLAADEQSVVRLIRGLGREDPGAGQPEVAVPAEPTAATQPTTADYQPPQGLGRALVEPEAPQPIWKKPWLIIAAAAAVVLLAAVLVIPALISGKHPKSPPANPAPQAAAPAMLPTPAPRAPAPRAAEKAREPKLATVKPSKQEPKQEAKAAPPIVEPSPSKPVAGSCDLTEGEIPRSLSRADSLMYAGKLEAAQDAFQRLLDCPSAHDKAAEGLRLVKQRIAAQSPSSQ